MSENLDLARRSFEAFNQRDFDAVESFYAPDAVLVGAEIGRFEGAAAIRGLYEDMTKPYADPHGEIDEIIDLGNGVVLTILAVVGHPVGSTSEVRLRYAAVAVLADGAVVQQTNYMDPDEARAAAERLAQERR